MACGTGVLEVTQSCWDVLCRLQLQKSKRRTQSDSEAEARLYWIDAICINQESTSEPSQQVAFMDAVYMKAQCVLVWPGRTSDCENLKWKFLNKTRGGTPGMSHSLSDDDAS